MNSDTEKMLQLLEKATAADDSPADGLDPETAPLREAWLALGQMLEVALPPAALSTDRTITLPLAQPRQWRLPAAGLLAASLIFAVAVAWMLLDANRPGNPAPSPQRIASTNYEPVPSKKAPAQTASTADMPQWDDSLDEEVSQIGWQMTCVRQNQLYRTDAIGLAQYQVDQLSQAIQKDSL